MTRQLTAWLLASLLLAGCARDPRALRWDDGQLAAERALSEGRHADARAAFERLEQSAASRADVVSTRMRRAESFRAEKRYGEAEAILAELARTGKGLELAVVAKIQYQLARVLLDAGRRDRGEARLWLVVKRFPDTAYGHRAFLLLRGIWRERSKDDWIERCRGLYRHDPKSELADNALYEAGRVYFERETDEDDLKAAELYQKVLDRWDFSTSSLWDDALWDMSLIHHRHRRYAQEVDLLERLLATREFTSWIGSYEHFNYKHAHFRLGRVHYENLRDYAGAARWFGSFAAAFPMTRMEDDALWWLGHSLAKAGQGAAARKAFERLVQSHPDSKYARRVREGAPPP